MILAYRFVGLKTFFLGSTFEVDVNFMLAF